MTVKNLTTEEITRDATKEKGYAVYYKNNKVAEVGIDYNGSEPLFYSLESMQYAKWIKDRKEIESSTLEGLVDCLKKMVESKPAKVEKMFGKWVRS